MKILHCSDLHLDAKMETGLEPLRARERRAELLHTLDRLVDCATEQSAKAILLCGDLFDTARVSDKTRRYVGDTVSFHPELVFFYVAGNHDAALPPLFADNTPPENWHAFPADRWESVTLGNVTVSGTSGLGRAGLLDALPGAPDGQFHIVMLHGQVVRGREEGGETVPLGRLVGRGIDYLALGHEHSFRHEPLDRRGAWAYPGCPEGRGFDECGIKGCILLDTDEVGAKRVTFLPLSHRVLHDVTLVLDGCESLYDITARINETLSPLPERDMVRLTLTGSLSPALPLDRVYIQTLLDERFFFARLHDKTRLLLRMEDLATDVSLGGEFIRTVMAAIPDEEERSRVISCGLRALRGEEVDG